MSRPASNRFYLADLVMAPLMCGLVLGLLTSARSPVDAGIVFFLICVVATIWSLFHARRKAPTCEECGRRFIEPEKPAVAAHSCPHCGRRQLERERSIRRWKRVRRNLLGLVICLLIVLAILLTGIACGLVVGVVIFAEPIAAVGVQAVLLAWFGVSIYLSRLERTKERPCEACGATIPLERPAGPAICPQCRVRHLRPDEAKEERSRNLRVSLSTFGMLAILAAFLCWQAGGPRSGVNSWVGFSLLVLGLLATMFVALVAFIVVVQLLRRRRLRSRRGALAMARESVGRDGEVVEEGPWTIWYSGPDDPVPMLREEMGAGCRRFAALTGAAEVAEPPRRIFVFHDRGAFLRFHQRFLASLDLTSFDGVQLGAPYRLITVCTAPAPCRITDPGRTIRSLAAYALLEATWGPRPPAWLQSGLGQSAARGEDRDERARLNRKLIAALARETAPGAEMFTMTLKGLALLMRGPKEPGKLQKLMEFHYQSWSMMEYLCGESATEDSRAAMGAFLRDGRSKADPEGSFRHHLGQGFGPLLDAWRRWVLDRGIGTYEPPPDRIRDGLLERVLPAIRDRRAKRGDRLVAIGEWANAGFVLGADALIGLLGDPGDLPKEQIVWALCMVSGMAWGDEPDRWQAWWDDLGVLGRRIETGTRIAGRTSASPIARS